MENIALDTFVLSDMYRNSANPLAQLLAISNEDTNNINVMNLRKRAAIELKYDLKIKRSNYTPFSLNDKINVDQYIAKATVLESLPAIQQNLHIPAQLAQIAANQVAMQVTLAGMQVTLAAIQANQDAMITRAANATVDSIEDYVTPPQNGPIPPPIDFPTTVQEILSLNPGNLLS
eukprot:gene3830-5236_t